MHAQVFAIFAAVLLSTAPLAHAQQYQFRQVAPGLQASPAVTPPTDPGEPDVDEFSLDQLEVTPNPVALAPTTLGMPVSTSVFVQNLNAGSVTISSASATVAQVTVSGGCLGVTLAANESCGFNAHLAADQVLSQSGAVLVLATSRGTKSVPLGNLVVSVAPTAIATFEPASSLVFAAIGLGVTSDREVTLTNTGNATLTLAGPPSLASPDNSFTLVHSTCDESLAPAAQCAVTVRFSPQSASPENASLQVTGNMAGGQASLSISGATLTSTAALSATLFGNFGDLDVGQSVSRTVTLRNVGSLTAEGVYLTLPDASGLAVSANSCGSVSAPVSLTSNQTCSAVLTWSPTAPSSITGLVVTSNGSFDEQGELVLSGTAGDFDAMGDWRPNLITNDVDPDEAFLDFSPQAVGTVSSNKTIFLYSLGTQGNMEVLFLLSGDTAHFGSPTLHLVNNYGSSATGCGGLDCTTTSSRPSIRMRVSYRPTSAGSHTLTITPVSANGTILPAPLTFTGQAN